MRQRQGVVVEETAVQVRAETPKQRVEKPVSVVAGINPQKVTKPAVLKTLEVKHESPVSSAEKTVLNPKQSNVLRIQTNVPAPAPGPNKIIHSTEANRTEPVVKEAQSLPEKRVDLKSPELSLAPELKKTPQPTTKYVKASETRLMVVAPEGPPADVVTQENTWFEETALYKLAEAEPLTLEPEVQKFKAELGLENQSDEITEQIIEATSVSPHVAEQSTALLVALPEQVQANLREFIDSAEPEAIKTVEAQIGMIALVADRLHLLVTTYESDSEEVAKIEQWLTEQYTELLNTLGADYNDETTVAFIAFIKSGDYTIEPESLASKAPYDPMRERQTRQDLSASDQDDATNLVELVHYELAKLMVHHSDLNNRAAA